MIKKVFFKNSRGLTLAGVLHIPRRNGPFPTVVLCHGFGSSKDSPERIKLAEKLAERGFVVLRFDFTGSGESEGRFEEKKLEGQIDDLKHAIDFIQADALVDGERIGASGNSLGGATCIIGASKDKRIKALAAVCPVVYFDPDRALHYLVKDAKHTSTVDAIKKINCPLLIIHGTNDELIPIEHARKLFEVANEPKELVEIKGADHNFSDEMHEKERQSRIIKWFEKWLKVKLGES